jgi:transposase-like protein
MTPASTHAAGLGGAAQGEVPAAVITCPLCHTDAPAMAAPDVLQDETWTCRTCGQDWSAARLRRAASYAVYALSHPAAVRRFADSIPKPNR